MFYFLGLFLFIFVNCEGGCWCEFWLTWGRRSTWSAPTECERGSWRSYINTCLMGATSCWTKQRTHRLLQTTYCGSWSIWFWSIWSQTEWNVIPFWWTQEMDGLSYLGPSRNQCWWWATILSHHCANTRRRYVTIVDFYYNNLLVFKIFWMWLKVS